MTGASGHDGIHRDNSFVMAGSRGNRPGNIVRETFQSFREARQQYKCRTPELSVIVAEHDRQSAPPPSPGQ